MSSPARNDKEDERLAIIRMSHQDDVRGGTKVLRRNGAGYVPWDMGMGRRQPRHTDTQGPAHTKHKEGRHGTHHKGHGQRNLLQWDAPHGPWYAKTCFGSREIHGRFVRIVGRGYHRSLFFCFVFY